MAPYNDQDSNVKTRADSDELRKITDIGLADEKAMDARAHEENGEQSDAENDDNERSGLNNLEDRSSHDKKETGPNSDDDEKDFAPNLSKNGGSKKRGLRGRVLNRKTAIGGGITGMIVGGGVFFSLLSPFGGLFNLDFAFDKPNRGIYSMVDQRIEGGFFAHTRAAREGHIGETRVGFFGSREVNSFRQRLATQHGIELKHNQPGQLNRISVDLDESHPLYRQDRVEQRRVLASALGLSEADVPAVNGRANGSRFVDIDITSTSRSRSVLRSLTQLDLDTSNSTRSQAILGMTFRRMIKYYDAPSKFRPLKWAKAETTRRIDARVGNAKKRYLEKHPGGVVSRAEAKYGGIMESFRSKAKPSTVAGAAGALALTGGICVVRDIADLMPGVNRAMVVEPSMEDVLEVRSVVSTIKAGAVENIGDIEAVNSQLVDTEGRSAAGAMSLNSLMYSGTGEGVDIIPEAKMAFTSRGGEVRSLLETLDLEFAAGAGDVADSGFFDAACSSWGLGIQVVGGLALSLIPPAGAATRAVSVIQGAMKSTIMAAVATHIVVGVAKDKVENLCGVEVNHQDESRQVKNAHKLGNCWAFASVAASDTMAASMGGAEVTGQQYAQLEGAAIEREQAEFQNKNFATRLFDQTESRSLFAKMSSTTPVNLNVSKLLSSAFSIPRIITSEIGSIFSAKAYGASPTYDFGAPRIAIPTELLEKYPNPYENADKMTTYTDLGDYKDRIKTCFGASISVVEGSLQATAGSEEVNPAESKYQAANCRASDEKWERIRVFILDDTIASTWACRDNDDASCSDLGLKGTSGTPEPSQPTNTGASAAYIPDCSANNGNAAIACTAIDHLLDIPYSMTLRASPTNPDPQFLDCSAFVGMAVYRTFSNNLGGMCSAGFKASSSFELIDVRDIQPGDIVGRGNSCVASGGNGHVGVVVSYDRTTKALVTAETDGKKNPSRIVTNKGLRIDNAGSYEWAVRYIGPQNPAPGSAQ